MIRCADEANLCGVYITTVKSDKFTYKTEGLNFHVYASNSESIGWKITSCHTGEGVAGVPVPTPDDDTAGLNTRSPYRAKRFGSINLRNNCQSSWETRKRRGRLVLLIKQEWARGRVYSGAY